MARVDRFSRHVHLKYGGLRGWCDRCPASSRHAALRRLSAKDGAGTISKRLNYLSNVANRNNNERLHTVARTDQRWVARELEHESVRRE